jgi:hemolysin III
MDTVNDVYIDPYATEVQTFTEELLNTIIHGTGLILSIPAAVLLVLLARRHGTLWHTYACGLYASSLVMMYTFSTLYHYSGIGDIYISTPTLRDLDHCAVFFLIAGTYTPLTLINVIYNNTNNPANLKAGKTQIDNANKAVTQGWWVLGIVWFMCAVGVTSKLTLGSDGLPPSISYSFYMLMGYMAALGGYSFFKNLPKTGLKLLVIGGILYTIGIVFLLSDHVPFNHPVWHMLVGIGSLCHYFSIIACCVPIAEQAIWKKMENRTRSKVLDNFTRFAYVNLCNFNHPITPSHN